MAHKTVEQLGREIETFQDEIRKLQKELLNLTHLTDPDIGKKVKEKTRHVRDAMGGLKAHTEQRASHIYDAVRHGGSAAIDRSRSSIGHKPVTAVIIAFAAGLVMSRVFGRMHS